MPEPKRLVFDLATSTLRCTGCGGKRRANGATISVDGLVKTCQAFVIEHATCATGDTFKRILREALENVGGGPGNP